MGEACRKRKRFLAEHPLCCFCGGTVAATTEDHVPPRAMFIGRHWPEGYSFPACASCNGGTSNDDRKFGFLVRLSTDGYLSPQDREDFKRLVKGIRGQDPKLIDSLWTSANERRRFFRESGIAVPAGKAAGEVPMANVGPEWTASLDVVSKKLARALHYMHTGCIVPREGRVEASFFPNTDILAGDFDPAAFSDLPASVMPVRNAKPVHDQFAYRYGVTEDGKHAFFVCMFRHAFAVALHTSCSPSELDAIAARATAGHDQ